MWVRRANANRLNYPRDWDGTLAHMLKLIKLQDYIKLAPIPRLAEPLAPEPESKDSDQLAVVDPSDMKVKEANPYETSSSSEE